MKSTKPMKLKTLKDLTLLDKFLFDETMDHPEIHEAALQIILGNDNLKLLAPTQTEKELRPAPWLKNIRMDVYALDQEKTVYNTDYSDFLVIPINMSKDAFLKHLGHIYRNNSFNNLAKAG